MIFHNFIYLKNKILKHIVPFSNFTTGANIPLFTIDISFQKEVILISNYVIDYESLVEKKGETFLFLWKNNN